MRLELIGLIAGLCSSVCAAHPKFTRQYHEVAQSEPDNITVKKDDDAFMPKVMIVSLFAPETYVWHRYLDFVENITIAGLSPLFPFIFCTKDHEICQVVTGEGEVNAASTITALTLSSRFDLSRTYFLIAGIAGINPHEATLGSVAFARFAISVGLQNEIDAREIPHDWSTGYFAYESERPHEYPKIFYGTEVFELNENLRDRAAELAEKACLNDSRIAESFRQKYDYEPANCPPSVVKCDVITSDAYFTGKLLGESFGNITQLLTNGTGVYCMTAQEDTAIMESFLRGSRFGLVDYSRIVIMRTGADFDRPPPGLNAAEFFLHTDQGAFGIAVENLYEAGNPFVQDILENWDCEYREGEKYSPDNYIGDVFGYIGGEPDFGFGSYTKYDYIAMPGF